MLHRYLLLATSATLFIFGATKAMEEKEQEFKEYNPTLHNIKKLINKLDKNAAAKEMLISTKEKLEKAEELLIREREDISRFAEDLVGCACQQPLARYKRIDYDKWPSERCVYSIQPLFYDFVNKYCQSEKLNLIFSSSSETFDDIKRRAVLRYATIILEKGCVNGLRFRFSFKISDDFSIYKAYCHLLAFNLDIFIKILAEFLNEKGCKIDIEGLGLCDKVVASEYDKDLFLESLNERRCEIDIKKFGLCDKVVASKNDKDLSKIKTSPVLELNENESDISRFLAIIDSNDDCF